jgi:hypothetical protein
MGLRQPNPPGCRRQVRSIISSPVKAGAGKAPDATWRPVSRHGRRGWNRIAAANLEIPAAMEAVARPGSPGFAYAASSA